MSIYLKISDHSRLLEHLLHAMQMCAFFLLSSVWCTAFYLPNVSRVLKYIIILTLQILPFNTTLEIGYFKCLGYVDDHCCCLSDGVYII